ncbi:MAG: prepilin-type N-terminal cleavage/methylation domain-containing protein [Acaryochloris sp. RU_4_1]|nr:prepilin-type N-terminal cleavage/methylation domain-containing protein [Acaryochloris sp. RU_4_1]NJR56790.1 prepilin-type N-terminal cleavage/methylation domain-containing protein [Acaryochloris sp. CRU_2_0]
MDHHTNKHKGFTLTEVLVGLLIASLFMATSMQAFVASTSFKARARQISEANNWVQDDLENVKTLSLDVQQVPYTQAELLQAVSASQNTLIVKGVNSGLRARDANYNALAPADQMKYGGDALIIGSDSNDNIIQAITTDSTTTPPRTLITLVNNLQTTQLQGSDVHVIARCRPQNASASGFAAYLKATLETRPVAGNTNTATPNIGTRTILGKAFTLTRRTTIKNLTPFQVLELAYRVTDNSGQTIATANTEVVPNAFFRCP